MEITILKDEKEILELEVASLTIVELLRVYLNENGAKIAVWRREHPSKNPILRIEADNPKKVLKEAIAQIEKEIDLAVEEVKKIK